MGGHYHTPNNEVTSPTATLESVLLDTTSNLHEGRDMAQINITNTFIQIDVRDKFFTMRNRVNLADLMSKIAPYIYYK